MTLADLETAVALTVGEEQEIFHSSLQIRAHLSAAETFLALARRLVENTVTFGLSARVGLYALRNFLPDYIVPLGFSIAHRQLQPTTLSSLVRADKNWLRNLDPPTRYCVLGVTLIGISPVPPANMNIQCTYAAAPPLLTAVSTTLTIGEEWHEIMSHYAAALLFAKEHDIAGASRELQRFLQKAALPRDYRFTPAETAGKQADLNLDERRTEQG